MSLNAVMPVRLARPVADLEVAERFWCAGVGLEVLWRSPPPVETGDGHGLMAVGLPGAAWHLELVHDEDLAARSRPSEEDLLVIYLGEPVPLSLLKRIEAAGGRRVPARNPYWDRWGVTLLDPTGYRLVLSQRSWP